MGSGIALRHVHRARFAATIIDVDQSGHAARATKIGRRGCLLTDPSLSMGGGSFSCVQALRIVWSHTENGSQ
jgi:hypothetical protein